jgi:AraC-like DNA-binding protein
LREGVAVLSLEVAIRLIVIGQQLLIATIFLTGHGHGRARLSGALFLAGVAAYLAVSSPELSSAMSPLMPLVTLFSIALPYTLWLFARDLFDSPLPPPWVTGPLIATGIVFWFAFNAGGRVSEDVVALLFSISRIASLVILAHTLWMSATGKGDDLLERRRQFRPVFVTLISIQAIAVLMVELVIGTMPPPGWLSMLNVILIGLMTIGISIPLLSLRKDFFPESLPEPETGAPVPALGAADRVLYDKLKRAMDEGAYRQTGLTISQLAGQLSYPEHKLRRLINQHLGFRNFSAFLNDHRIREAQERLADPEEARTPVLTVALDLGYGSLGPFNRAFKAISGMTPTDWREQKIPADSG